MAALAAQMPSLEEVRAEKARRRCERARASLAEFARQAWDIVEPGTPLVWNWHLDAICDHLQAVTDGRIRNLMINVPPGHMKSLLVSVFWPAWRWIDHPEWRSLFSSYAEGLSLRDSVKCRTILESTWYRDGFVKGKWELSGDQNVKSFYLNTRQGFRIATSVGGKATGLRAHTLVVDDPLNAEDAFSAPAREQVIRWWRYTFGNRLADMRTGSKVVIMQRLHEEDLSGWLLKEESGDWEHLCLPTEFERARLKPSRIGWRDPRREEGDLLFPEMFPREVVEKERRRLGSLGYPGQHQQRPTAAEGGMFLRKWWRFWRHAWEDEVPELADRTVVLPEKFDRTILSWDCAFKKTSDSDRVAGGAWARKGPDSYLLDLEWDRMSFSETVARIRSQAKRHPTAHEKIVEDKANGPAAVDVLSKEITGMIAVSPEGGKESRAAATSPQVESGNVFLPLHAKWRDEYIEEHAAFPRGAHDDAVDQQSQALLRFKTRVPPSFGSVSGPTVKRSW